MGKTQVRATLLATTAVLTIIASANANVVDNFDFESGVLGPWAVSCPDGVCGVVADVGNPGFAFRGFNNSATPGTLSQLLATPTPGIYRVQFDHRSLDAPPPNTLSARFGGSNAIVAPLTTAYETRTAFVATGLANTPLTFEYTTEPGTLTINVDNVVVELVDDGKGNNIAAAAQTVAVQASREFLDRLQGRFNDAGSPIRTAMVRETVFADAGGMSYVNAGGKYRAFMSVFGSDAEWDDSAASAERRGLSAGIEVAATSSLDVGVAFSLSRSEFDTRTIFTRNDGEADEYLGAIYAHWSPSSAPVYFNLIAGYGQSSNDFSRTSLVGLGTVSAQDVDSSQWFGSAEFGFDWALSERFMLTPFARIDGATIDQDGYSEVQPPGVFLVPAVVAGRDFDALRSVVGVRAEVGLDVGRGGKLGGKVGWAHDFEQDRFVTFTETTGPVSFSGVAGAATPAEDAVVAGASLELSVSDQASVYAGYNGDFADEQEIHAGEVGLRVTW
jgi:outer membrane autotransporter protein